MTLNFETEAKTLRPRQECLKAKAKAKARSSKLKQSPKPKLWSWSFFKPYLKSILYVL